MRARIKWINSIKAGMGLVCFVMLTLVVSSQPLKWNEPAQITKQNFSIKLPELGSKQYEENVIDIPSSKLSKIELFIVDGEAHICNDIDFAFHNP